MRNFSQTTQQELGHYVYALVDPRDGKIFYIGKGEGNRVFDHANAALAAKDVTPSDKLNTINSIIASGKQVQTLILRHGLQEHEAFMVESVLIDLFTHRLTKKRKIDAKMTNKQAGHDMRELGIKTADEIEAQYASQQLGNVSDKLVIININKTYNSNITIYDATRICWRLSKKRADQAQYILSEYHGVVRAVFQMDEKKWQPIAVPGKKAIRYFFTGHEVTDPNVLNLYINKKIVKRHGDSNPIHYRNIK